MFARFPLFRRRRAETRSVPLSARAFYYRFIRQHADTSKFVLRTVVLQRLRPLETYYIYKKLSSARTLVEENVTARHPSGKRTHQSHRKRRSACARTFRNRRRKTSILNRFVCTANCFFFFPLTRQLCSRNYRTLEMKNVDYISTTITSWNDVICFIIITLNHVCAFIKC